MQRRVFITGGSGYIGRRLIPVLANCGHRVTALVRPGSESKIEARCELFLGNALDGDSYAAKLRDCDTMIHMVGVSHPSPAKAKEFVAVDLRSGREAIRVASQTGICHFIYISVAQPAPVMKEYIDVRAACEATLRESGLPATILRPWYVLGPGHRWPVLLKPLYSVAERIPSLREGATRLGLVTIDEMVQALAAAAGDPVMNVRVWEVPAIKNCRVNFDSR